MEKQPDYGLDFSKFFKQEATPETIELIKKEFEKVFKEMPTIGSHKVDRCGTLWQFMTLKEKALWFFYNKITSIGHYKRIAIQTAHYALVKAWIDAYPDEDAVDCPYRLEIPSIYQPNPKTIVVFDTTIKLIEPLKYIKVDLEIKDDASGKTEGN